jgi:predicted RNase H-like HicB family nuclease
MGSLKHDDHVASVDEACEEAEQALKLFLQGKFDEAETFVEERVKTREQEPGVVPIFTHCHAVILFAKAGITGTEEDRKQAMDMLKEAASKAGEHIPKQGWVAWGMGYFSSSKAQEEITEVELSCRIIEAESTYLSAILCFFEESMAAFFRAALLTRTAIGGYRHCHSILKNQQAGNRSKHNVGAVKLGFGGFSLAISLLPPRLLRLLSVLGFPCDRAAGLDSIDQSLQGGGLRAPVGGVLLLSYHVILPSFFFHSTGKRGAHCKC